MAEALAPAGCPEAELGCARACQVELVGADEPLADLRGGGAGHGRRRCARRLRDRAGPELIPDRVPHRWPADAMNRTIEARARREGWSAPADERAKGPAMSTSSNPGPHEQDGLAPWARDVLAGIENDMTSSDPGLADAMSRAQPRARRWWPLSGPSTGLLVVGLIVLVPVGALLPASAWAVLRIVTALVVVQWLLLAATERNRSD
jgi:hypothetical protein